MVDDGYQAAAIVALDLMVIDDRFARITRQRITGRYRNPAAEHFADLLAQPANAPEAAGGLRGVGECDPAYEDWASRQAATAAILAWRGRRVPARASIAHDRTCRTWPTIRTRAGGPVDTTWLTTLHIQRTDGMPLAMIVNYQAHPCVYTIMHPFDVSRDVPGEVCDIIEAALPGVTAMYIQGACGDVVSIPTIQRPSACHEPAWAIAAAATQLASRDARLK